MNKRLLITWVSILALLIPSWAFAITFPDKPPPENYHVDEAGLINAEAAAKIDEAAAALLAEERIPLYVVTIPSLSAHDAVTLSIEAYAYELFNEWGIGWQDRNYGILLLVSRDDRKARIELGADRGGNENYQAQRIMDELIVSSFKRGDFSTGIADGVRGLDAMARGLALPKPKTPWWFLPVILGGFVLMVVLIVNLFRTGRKGWAWALLAVLGVVLFFLIRTMLANSGSGGGFGGGSSGGGGATGSW